MLDPVMSHWESPAEAILLEAGGKFTDLDARRRHGFTPWPQRSAARTITGPGALD